MSTILASTTFDLPGYRVVETRGLCWGVIVRSVGLARGITGSLKSLRAGEVSEFTNLVSSTRQQALDRLLEHVAELGGNAALGVRFDSSDLGNGLAEIIAYGTVAVVERASS